MKTRNPAAPCHPTTDCSKSRKCRVIYGVGFGGDGKLRWFQNTSVWFTLFAIRGSQTPQWFFFFQRISGPFKFRKFWKSGNKT